MSLTPDWLDGLIANKDTLVSKLESVGFLDSVFVNGVENELGAGVDAVMRAMNEIDRLETQLRASEEESVAQLARQFLKNYAVNKLRTALRYLSAKKSTGVQAKRGIGTPLMTDNLKPITIPTNRPIA
uniref:Uncharacterized protein n=1 Tax=Pristionchus pacificus TaxID=54126 RepID=A0A2A6C1B3_PRIPA